MTALSSVPRFISHFFHFNVTIHFADAMYTQKQVAVKIAVVINRKMTI